MIEGVEDAIQRIADGAVEAVPCPWTSASIGAIFYADNSDYMGDFVTPEGGVGGFVLSMEMILAFGEIRDRLREAGKPVWGQARMELTPDGKFSLKWGYENCDADGNTIWDADAWTRRQEERQNRLTM